MPVYERAERIPAAVTVREAAAALHCSPGTIRRRLVDGTLPMIRFGGSIRIPASAIRDLIEPDTQEVA
jgi:excisionase family DNA binding protein